MLPEVNAVTHLAARTTPATVRRLAALRANRFELDRARTADAPIGRTFGVLGVEGVAMSRRLNAREEVVAGYAVANLTYSRPSGWHGVGVTASIYNVFNRQYGDPASDVLRQRAIPQDGRSIRLTVQLAR